MFVNFQINKVKLNKYITDKSDLLFISEIIKCYYFPGVSCRICHKVALIPVQALCSHVCCLQCWKTALMVSQQF